MKQLTPSMLCSLGGYISAIIVISMMTTLLLDMKSESTLELGATQWGG